MGSSIKWNSFRKISARIDLDVVTGPDLVPTFNGFKVRCGEVRNDLDMPVL
jgi:hypothetical protein